MANLATFSMQIASSEVVVVCHRDGDFKNVSREQKGRSTPTKTVGPWQSISQNNKPFDNLTFCPPYSQTLT